MNRISTFIMSSVAILAICLQVIADPADPNQGRLDKEVGQATLADGQRIPFQRKAVLGVPTFRTRTMNHTRTAAVDPNVVPQLYVLLPEEVAITTRAQPSLFWYLSRPVDRPIKLTISTPESIEPVLELEIDAAKRQGIQRLDLSKLPIRLKPSVRYDWVIAVASDEAGMGPKIYAKSVVWRIESPKALASRLTGAKNRRQRAAIAAEEGIWIDALAGISNLIEHKPNDSSLRRDRADLLRQVGFQVVIKSQGDDGYSEHVHYPTTVQLGSAQ